MSTATLFQDKISWSAAAEASLDRSSWFKSFDQLLNEIDPDASLAVRQDAETWYVISDADMINPSDPTPTLGLDTWDF